MMRYGELFAGVGGFSLGLERIGMECAWHVEIDLYCQMVLARHWPDVPRHLDVRTVGAHNLAPVDLIVGGFPCQDLSVAGLRAGFEGQRSALWFEFERIIRELRPRFVLIENVPGLLSSRDGNDARLVLDQLLELGYVVDIDICDARYFGVPQRRRRVFITCQHVSHILQMRTSTSARIIGQAITEILLSALVVLKGPSSIGSRISDCPSALSIGGLRKRMKLFGVASKNDWTQLLRLWDDVSRKCQPGLANSDSDSESLASLEGTSRMATGKPTNTMRVESDRFDSIASQLWSDSWGAISSALNSSTTSTSTRATTTSEIYGCARLALLISERTARLNTSSSPSSNEESSILTALRGFTDYARQTSSDLFGDLGRIREWWDFRERAEGILHQSKQCLGGHRAGQILLERESSPRDSEAGTEAGQGLAYCLEARSGGIKPAWNTTYISKQSNSNCAGDVFIDQSPTQASDSGGYIVARSLNAEHSGYRMDAESETLIPFDTTQITSKGNYSHPQPGDVCHPLAAGAHAPAIAQTLTSGGHPGSNLPGRHHEDDDNLVAFNYAQGSECTRPVRPSGYAGSMNTNGQEAIASPSFGVRRLTPRECERLMGWADDHTRWTPEGREIPDSQRYRMCGNGVVASVVEWIGRRLLEAIR